MAEFVPPFPHRFTEAISAWKRISLARRNVIAMWEAQDFEREFSSTKLVSKRAFLCNSPDSVKFAFGTHNASFERKSPQMRHALAPLAGDGLIISDGETWRTRRRIVAPILHMSRMADFMPAMTGAINDVRARWHEREGTTIDVLSESAALTADVIYRVLFGTQITREYSDAIVEAFNEYQNLVGQIDLISLLGLPDWFPRRQNPAVRRSARRIHAVLDEVIETSQKLNTENSSVIHRLQDAHTNGTGAPLTREALRNEIAVLFLAGQETTANSIAWTWYLLSQAPEVEAKLHEEIDRVVGDRSPALSDIQNLVYTRAIFDEALRLYPPIPVLPREAVMEERYRDRVIPKGSFIFVVPWLLHRHRALWENPDHFIPERFLPENAAKIHKFSYIPFSIGPRICAGLSLGMTEAVLSIATLAQSFTLRLKEGHQVTPVARLTLRPEGGLPMTLHRRRHVRDASTEHAAQKCPFGAA